MEDKYDIDPYEEENWNEVVQDFPKFTSFIDEPWSVPTSGSSRMKHIIRNGRFTHKKYRVLNSKVIFKKKK